MRTSAQLDTSAKAAAASARALQTAATKTKEAEDLRTKAKDAAKLADDARRTAQQSFEAIDKAADGAAKDAAKAQHEKDAKASQDASAASDVAKLAADEAADDAALLERFAGNVSAGEKSFASTLKKAFGDLSTYVLIFLALLVAFLFWRVTAQDGKFLALLGNAASSRGLITFLITATTVSIAVVLIYQAFAEGVVADNFRMAREVFGTLVGVLGTIVGFYFGIATDGAKPGPLAVSPLSVNGSHLTTSIAGGSEPYHWVVSGDPASQITKTEGDAPKPGALSITLPEIKGSGKATLSITDAGGTITIVTADVKKTAAPAPAPPPGNQGEGAASPPAPKKEK